MRQAMLATLDVGAVAFGFVASPVLRMIARKRMALPRFQRFSDKAGFQLRSEHYYEPTYREADLPADTRQERALPGLELNETAQLALLDTFVFGEELVRFPREASPGKFGYINGMYGYGDAETYYSIVRAKKPRRIIEIGSGFSTLIALAAIEANRRDDPAYACDMVCVEPFEVRWLEATGVRVIRERVEHLDLALFDTLESGDILFIDSSHVIRPYGDVLREFQEIIPRLKAGVMVQVHDVFTPRDYPEKWLREDRRLWNEQYLMESFLAYNARFDVMCATNWLKHNHFDAFARACPMMARYPETEPGAFWFVAK